ncbi:MAG: 16S rRNA (uracil(1498)-N(3))-methyltransferase [Symbiobacteriia bacterium]
MTTRFFVPTAAVQDDEVTFTGEDLHHLARVLRLGPGDRVIALTDEGDEYDVELATVASEAATGRITARRRSAGEPPLQVTLVQGLAKGDKMDLIVQKCTEVGVTRFWPVHTERAVVHLEPAKAAQRRLRWQVIAREAAEQSRRGRVPAVTPVAALQVALQAAVEALNQAPGQVLALFPWEEERGRGLAEVLAAGQRQTALREVWLFIGPEGGFSQAEALQARAAGLVPVSLGPRILRTETAGLAAAVMVLFALGDLGRGPDARGKEAD